VTLISIMPDSEIDLKEKALFAREEK